MKNTIIARLAIVAATLNPVDVAQAENETANPLAVKEILGLIDAAQEVRSYRMNGTSEIAGAKKIDHYYVKAEGPVLTAEQHKAWGKVIRDALTNLKEDGSRKACDPQPGVALAFKSGKGLVELMICYECKIWEFYVDGKQWRGSIDFDSANTELIKLAKALFPDDKEIQGL
jgi:hypothetical protein